MENKKIYYRTFLGCEIEKNENNYIVDKDKILSEGYPITNEKLKLDKEIWNYFFRNLSSREEFLLPNGKYKLTLEVKLDKLKD